MARGHLRRQRIPLGWQPALHVGSRPRGVGSRGSMAAQQQRILLPVGIREPRVWGFAGPRCPGAPRERWGARRLVVRPIAYGSGDFAWAEVEAAVPVEVSTVS